MTKEELEKEVEEYLEKKHCKNVCTCNEIEECKKGIRIRCTSFNYRKELIFNFAELWEKQIAELEKENAELKTKVTALENANRAMVKELDDTTSGGLNILQNVVKNKEELTKSKELLNEFMKYEINEYDGSLEIHFEELKKQAEQFLKENV